MAKIADGEFSGASGTKYAFEVYPSDSSFKDVGAVYVFTRRTVSEGTVSHKSLYIGEADALGSRISSHEKWPCVRQYDVNCICVHREENKQTRLDIESDLIARVKPPCND